MEKRPDFVVNNWYQHLDKGLIFEIVAIDDDNETIEIQYIDGNLDEIGFSDISGPFDIGEIDDYGTQITDTSKQDWEESFEEVKTQKNNL